MPERGARSAAPPGTRPSISAGETLRRRDELLVLRDHLERLLCPLLNAMPRHDVEALLAGGNTELIQFGRPAVAAAVVTAMLQTPSEWTSVRRAIHAACRGGQSLNGSGAEQDNAAELAEQLLARLDFGLSLYQRRREALNAGIRRCRGDAPTTEADSAPSA